ncbi:MAG: DDE-type integrase/transposase/recombinase [Candidatus Pacearchaeota archaeon]
METTQDIKQFADNREQRAKQILEHSKPECLDENTYLVPSQFDSSKKYEVTHFDSYSCNCKDFELRCKGKGLYCKHIKAILLFEKLKNAYEIEETPLKQEMELILENSTEKCCPYCKSTKLIKRGVRHDKTGDKQRFGCKDCKKRFVLEPIKYIKGNAKLVCLAMDCYYKGLSYRDITDTFNQFYGLKLHHETIRRWVLRFTEVMEKYSKTLTPKTSGVWNADETLVLTKRGKTKIQNSEFDYVWNCMDNQTKFLLASVNSGRSRKSKDAQKVFTEAYKQNGKMPNQIIVDGYKGYEDGCRNTFRNFGRERKIKFTSIKGHRHETNNNAIENLHTHQKEMLKVRRGVTETQTYADGFKVFHNFIKKAEKDKLTPAERCGIEVKGNRWNTLLLNSIKK